MDVKRLPISLDNLFKGTMYTMILCATGHLLTTLYIAIRYDMPDAVNMFNIIGLSLLFPFLEKGALNGLLGILFVIAIGIWFSFMQERHDRHPHSRKNLKS